MENRKDFRASNMGETVQGSLLNQPPSENNGEDVKKLHEVIRSLNVGTEMPPNALTYEQVPTKLTNIPSSNPSRVQGFFREN
jgi:hypothetical protein